MRLFETESYVFNKKMEELIGHADDVPIKTIVDLDRIVRISQWTSDDDELNILEDQCMIYIDDRTSLLIGTSYEEMILIWKGEKK